MPFWLRRPARSFRWTVRRPHALHAAAAQRDEQHIVLWHQEFCQLPAQLFHTTRVEPTAKYRILHPLAVPLHVLRGLPQALWISDVVADQPPVRSLHRPLLLAKARAR